jgi:glycosyltransferase involved in cell wall biosynthesis
LAQNGLRKIAFIRPGRSIANQQVAKLITSQFPEYDVQVIDILRRKDARDPLNILRAVAEYSPAILRNWQRLHNDLFKTPYFFRKIKTMASRVIHPDTHLFSFQMQSLFDASVPGVPHFVYTDHTRMANLDYDNVYWQDVCSTWLECERSIYHHAALNFTRSSNITRSLTEQYGCPPEQVVQVYAGSNVTVDLARLPDPRKYTSKNILFVGVDWERKGGPELLAAFRRVLEVHPDARLTIVGCWPRVDVPNCEVVGKVALEDLPAYYEQAAVFCLPTKREPFGIVFVEAMSFWLPIVATPIGAIPDMVQDGQNGYLVAPPDNVARLAEALIMLLDDPQLCRRFGERGHQIAVDRYTWKQTGKRMRAHIDRIVWDRYPQPEVPVYRKQAI